MNLGISELIVILMVLLLIFGGSRLPQIGESLGRTARSFKRGFGTNDDIKVEPTAAQAQPAPEAHAQLKAPPAPAAKLDREIADAELIDKKG